jgi:hypothetical protein
MRLPLPSEYVRYLLENGLFEGFTKNGTEPGYVELWAINEISEINSEIEIECYAPGFVGFAGNGGNEVLVFDMTGAVFMLPLIGMEPAQAIRIADNFLELAQRFVR